MNKMNKNADIIWKRHPETQRKWRERERVNDRRKARLKLRIKKMNNNIKENEMRNCDEKKNNILRALTFCLCASLSLSLSLSISLASFILLHLLPAIFHPLNIFITFHLFNIFLWPFFLFFLQANQIELRQLEKKNWRALNAKFLGCFGLGSRKYKIVFLISFFHAFFTETYVKALVQMEKQYEINSE